MAQSKILIRLLIAAASLMAAQACGKEPATTPAQAPAQLTAATLVGRWGDNGDCAKDINIRADGTFQSYTGGEGRWTLQGDRMTMSGAGGVFEVRVDLVNADTLMIGNPDGSYGLSQRCP